MNSIKESFKRGAGRLKWFAGLMGELDGEIGDLRKRAAAIGNIEE